MKTMMFLALAIMMCVSSMANAAVNAPFYKIEKNGQVAYLLGSIHIGVNFSELNPNVLQAVTDADSIVLETDLAGASSLMAKAFPMGADNSLKNQLTPEEWTKLYTQIMAAPGAGPMIAPYIDQLHPAMAASFYQSAYLPVTAQPIDQTIYNIAIQSKKNFMYFEDPQVQIDALIKTQNISSLKNLLAAPLDQLKKSMDMMVTVYSGGNEVLLSYIFVNSMPVDEKKTMLIDRNAAWVAGFDAIFATPGTEFIAVGAAHLLTDIGLVRQLQLKGYTVTRQ